GRWACASANGSTGRGGCGSVNGSPDGTGAQGWGWTGAAGRAPLPAGGGAGCGPAGGGPAVGSPGPGGSGAGCSWVGVVIAAILSGRAQPAGTARTDVHVTHGDIRPAPTHGENGPHGGNRAGPAHGGAGSRGGTW